MEKIVRVILLIFISILAMNNAYADSVLRIPVHASVISFDPSKVQDTSSLWVSRQITCQLVRMSGGILVMEAAQTIRYNSPLEIDVQLKPNILFSNGSELTSEDVTATFNYLQQERSSLRNVFNWIKDIKIKGKYEFVIELKKPTPQILTVLASPNYALFEKNFIGAVSKNSSLWKTPVSCGNYKIAENHGSIIKLLPTKEGLPINFYLLPDSQLAAKDIDNFDIVSLQLMGNSNKLSSFNAINVFDPFQYYFAFNTNVLPWKDKDKRCAFFSKLDPTVSMKVYGDQVRPADDFLPSGTLGYDAGKNNITDINNEYKNTLLPNKKTFCVSFIASAVEKNYRPAYLEMIQKLYPNATAKIIDSYTNLPTELKKQKCDGTFFALKSNYLDAYEYLITLSEKGPNATGYRDDSLAKQIENSQNIDQPNLRANEYQVIIKKVNHLCLMYPLFTMPYDVVYVRNTIKAPDIGKSSINEYYLGKVSFQ